MNKLEQLNEHILSIQRALIQMDEHFQDRLDTVNYPRRVLMAELVILEREKLKIEMPEYQKVGKDLGSEAAELAESLAEDLDQPTPMEPTQFEITGEQIYDSIWEKIEEREDLLKAIRKIDTGYAKKQINDLIEEKSKQLSSALETKFIVEEGSPWAAIGKPVTGNQN